MSRATLTPRDFRFLETLYDYGLMSTPQIERKVFRGIRNTTVLRRLRKLEKQGLISRSSGLEQGASAWWITAKGGSLIGFPQGYGQLNRHTLAHDVLISQVRLCLEEIGGVESWKSGHFLKRAVSPKKSASGILPDGILLMPTCEGGRVFAIEVECTAKAKGRYVRVLQHYSEKKSIQAVWYIVSHPRITKPLMKALGSRSWGERKGDWVFWTPLSEILQGPEKIVLRSVSRSIRLKDLVPEIRASLASAQAGAHPLSRGDQTDLRASPDNSAKDQESLAR